MSAAVQRMLQEYRNYITEKQKDGVKIEIVDGNVLHLKGTIDGPTGSPYEGGKFDLDIRIGEDYPHKEPTIKFITKIWHPSVNPFNGTICLDNMGSSSWPTSITIHETLKNIRSWLVSDNDIKPLDYDIHIQKRDNKEIFEKTAKYWSVKYAGAPFPKNRDCEMRVGLVMNITRNNEDLAIVALSCHDWALPRDIGNFVRCSCNSCCNRDFSDL